MTSRLLHASLTPLYVGVVQLFRYGRRAGGRATGSGDDPGVTLQLDTRPVIALDSSTRIIRCLRSGN